MRNINIISEIRSNTFSDFEPFPVKPHFKDPEDFMVVRSGNSIRIKINYEVRNPHLYNLHIPCLRPVNFLQRIFFISRTQAAPLPDIKWLKNGEPVSPWNKIIHDDGTCTLIVPSSKYSDSGVYTIVAKNSSGQASFDIEVRVTGKVMPLLYVM